MPGSSSTFRTSMASKKPVKTRHTAEKRRSTRISSQETSDVENDSNDGGDSLFEDENEEQDDNDEQHDSNEESEEENEATEDDIIVADSTYLKLMEEEQEAKRKADAARAKKAKKEAEKRKIAALSPASKSLKASASPAPSRKRGKATNSYKLAKDWVTQLENTKDYDATKDFIANSLWRENYRDVEASLDDIDLVHEIKHSQTQKNLYKEGVEQHGLNKVFQGDYRELTEALQQEIQARKESVAAHAEEIAAFDMKINYLRVRTEDLRQKNGVEADLKTIIRQHKKMVLKLI